MTVPWRGIAHPDPPSHAVRRFGWLGALVSQSCRIGWPVTKHCRGTAPAEDGNRTKEGHDNWLVVVGICTHMGCLLKSQEGCCSRYG